MSWTSNGGAVCERLRDSWEKKTRDLPVPRDVRKGQAKISLGGAFQ